MAKIEITTCAKDNGREYCQLKGTAHGKIDGSYKIFCMSNHEDAHYHIRAFAKDAITLTAESPPSKEALQCEISISTSWKIRQNTSATRPMVQY
jgi:hypothetical protein